MQYYAINQVPRFLTFVPGCLFVFSTFTNISSSNEDVNTFLLVVMHFYRYSPSHASLSKLSKAAILWAL